MYNTECSICGAVLDPHTDTNHCPIHDSVMEPDSSYYDAWYEQSYKNSIARLYEEYRGTK
jgi:uncharacterized Zn finger protein (UPF0148 family)